MHGGLPFIGISTIVYGVIGLTGVVITAIRTKGGARHAHHHRHRSRS
ncbi:MULTISPECIES: hypothetical protein [Streptomyces]|uniref:Uncharacterized protein n=1 Tax=Streptomyces siderophoricus TaxID=2802281 RepID=A0ABS1MWS6_9ACTN|nr:hypothetical protein [Streptomyces sp. 9-7]MBL1092171.1 hypothetical protein [Streptomyces sp. 9-7]